MTRGAPMVDLVVRKDGTAPAGHGETLGVSSGLGDGLTVSIRRESRRADGRGGRDIRIDLDRREALALGRHLIGEASGLALALDDEPSELLAGINLWNTDDKGRFLALLRASAVGEEVLLSMERLRETGFGLRQDGGAAVVMTPAEIRALARALLAMTGE